MSANSSLILTNLDFDTLKNTFKSYLKSQDKFKDYDFDGSNMSVLLDLLSYNTYMNSFYLNMIGNEMFLDTAQLRDSIVSHAKELNYTPRSFTSARALVDIEFIVQGVTTARRSVTIPKGTPFSTRIGNRTFTFVTDRYTVTDTITVRDGTTVFTAHNVELYEGDYFVDSFVVNSQDPTKYILSNPTIDTTSLSVIVLEDVGATPLPYSKASSLLGLNSDSQVYFLQGVSGERYEIQFGDGVIGRKPKHNSTITCEYRACSGELPNGAFDFRSVSTIDGVSNVRVITRERAAEGTVSESLDEIRFNAPRHFNTQERAITTEDYESLLKVNFPEINTATAYGGEEVDPPQYGKVIVSVDLKDLDGLPEVKKREYYNFLKSRAPVSIDPVFVNPDYMYINVDVIVKYNINTSGLSPDDIRTLVLSSIIRYANDNLNNFNRTLRYSKLVQSIDSSHSSIVSNETDIKAVKYLTPLTGRTISIDIDYAVPLSITIPDMSTHSRSDVHTVASTRFTYNGLPVYFEDDGAGNIRLINTQGGRHTTIKNIGTVDYERGLVQITGLNIERYEKNIKVTAQVRSKDIATRKNTILNISEEDVNIVVQQVRE